ncbi:MAG: ABC transporter ATP-binding protein, partial [Alphaproteobacteria bacterium]|nr:ABC transporter ATP-binding protein [Alphaproteobacteria bacterium]
AIEVEGLSKRFGEDVAVDVIDFEVPRGGVTALLGGNGAGKTTTIGMLLGLVLPSAGRVRVLGVDMLRHRHRVLARMNFSSPYVDLPHRLTVAQNLRVYAHLYGVARVRERIQQLAEDLDIGEFLKRPVGKLSAGQRTRVALAKALINDPELLLLDEPTASLDPDSADWVRGYLESWRAKSGATIVLASHNMAEVERMCGNVVMLREGSMVDRGSPKDLIARYGRESLEEVFLDIARERKGAAAE